MSIPTATLLKVIKRTPTKLDAVYKLDPPMVDKRQPEIAVMYARVVSAIDVVSGSGSVRVFECDDRGGTLALPLNHLRGSRDGVFDHAFALADAGYESIDFRAERGQDYVY